MSLPHGWLLLVLLWCWVAAFGKVASQSASNDSYNKFIRPYAGVKALDIKTKIYVRNLNSIDETKFSYKIDFIIYHWYNDPRLAITAKSKQFLQSIHSVNQIWFPNLGLINCRDTKDIKDSNTVKIKPNGDVFAHKRVTTECYCLMDLRKFPMDTQHCPFHLESYSYSNSDIKLKWHTPAVQFEEGLRTVGYKLRPAEHKKFTMGYGYGVWEVMAIDFVFERVFLHFIYRVYIPIILLMIFNFSSYWIPITAIPARVTLIITTFLTMTFILQSVSAQTSKSSNTTSLQIFIVFSIILVVVAVLEFLVVLYFSSKMIPPGKSSNLKLSVIHKISKRSQTAYNVDEQQNNQVESKETVAETPCKHYDVMWIDKLFRYGVPICYFLFVVIYFTYFSIADDLRAGK